jgi:hypothetical protein
MKRACSASPFAIAIALACLAPLAGTTGCGDDDDSTGGSGGQTGQPGSFAVTISGEDLALEGYAFDAATASSQGDPPAFVDGWTIKFDHVVITVGNLRLNEGPDTNPSDPSQVGAEIARSPGVWAVDLAKPGAETDKGSGQPGAWRLTTLDGNFDASTRYAFSYDTLPASATASKVGFDAGSEALYQQAVTKGWAMAFQGKATFVGKPTPPLAPPFDAFSKTVNFTIGLANASSYINCQNPDLGSGGDEAQRGVQTLPNQAATVQIALHTDHLFWDALDVEGTPLHFDHIASQAAFDAQNPAAPGVVTSDDLANVLLNTMYIRGTTTTLPSRTYVADYTPAQSTFVPDPGGTGITTLLDYLAYTQASGGHLNADGECEVVRLAR